MSTAFVKKTFVNIYMLKSGEDTPVCCSLKPIANFDKDKALAIVNALIPCLESSVSIQSVKKVEGYVIIRSEE